MEPRIYKVVVMYRNLSAREAVTIYVLAFSGEEAEGRATDAMSLISGQNRKLIAMEYLVDRTVNWIAISSHDGVIAERMSQGRRWHQLREQDCSFDCHTNCC